MLCAVCILLLSKSSTVLDVDLSKADPAVTNVTGTYLCAAHAVEKMEKLAVLQGMGVQ